MSIWTRIKDFGPWSRAQKERDLEHEIQNHLDLEAEESGHGAQRAFGNAMLVKEGVKSKSRSSPGVSRRSVQAGRNRGGGHIDTARERECHGIGRPAKTKPFRRFVTEISGVRA